jgi:prevent-host-death family protein
MQTYWAIQNAKNQFSKVVDTALQGTPQVVTRRGVPVVVVVSADQYNYLTKKEQTNNGFARFLLSMPIGTRDSDAGNIVQNLELREVEF